MDELKQGLPRLLRAFFYEVVRLKKGTAPHLFFEGSQDLEKLRGFLLHPKGTCFYLNFEYLGGLEGSGMYTQGSQRRVVGYLLLATLACTATHSRGRQMQQDEMECHQAVF
jgi:hypothetical protein